MLVGNAVIRLVQKQVVHHFHGIVFLRFNHLGEELVFRRNPVKNAIPRLQLVFHDRIGRTVNVDGMLGLELDQIIGITKGAVPVEVRVFGFGSVFQNGLKLF